jgi:ribosomal protein L21E
MKQSFYNGTWGGFYTVASSNMTDMPGQGKVKRSSAVLPVYIDKKNQIELGVSGDGFKLGKAGSSQVLKNLKDFRKSDLQESINERAWTPAQEKAVKELDKKFYKVIGKKGIEPYSYEASQMWTSGGFRKEMRKIFGKDVKESVNENISDSQKFKIYNSLKKGDIVSIKYDSSIAKGSKFRPFLVTKGKTKLMKGKVERIIMIPADTKNKKFKRYLYNRNGSISMAIGDMGAVIVDMKKGEVNEGTCGYGEGGKLGEKPAGPHLLKRKKKKDVNEARLDPKQLLQQLGGNRFIAMTGAKNLAFDKVKNTLHMKIGRNAKGVNHLRIKLTGADLYDMEFLQVRAGNVKVKAKEKGVYNDQLQKMFTKHTGMYTSL